MPSMDRAGNLCLWGQTPRYGLTIIRISVDGRRQAWQEVPLSSEPWFEPRELVCDSSGRYIASIYRDHPVRFGGGTGGLAVLDIATDTWSTVPLPHRGRQKKSQSQSRTKRYARRYQIWTRRGCPKEVGRSRRRVAPWWAITSMMSVGDSGAHRLAASVGTPRVRMQGWPLMVRHSAVRGQLPLPLT